MRANGTDRRQITATQTHEFQPDWIAMPDR
jgi:hypothetical protein